MNLIPISRTCVAASTALLLCVLPLALPLVAASDDEESSKKSTQPGLDEAALKRVMPGTWKWKIKKSGKDGMTDILLSFDDNRNVVGSATITDGALLMTPRRGPVPLKWLQDAETGLESPERGVVLELPLPGIQQKPARLLLRSIHDKKIECLDLADTDKPLKVTFVKTTDRLLSDIAGPDKPAPPPAPPEQMKPADPPPEPAVAEKPRPAPARRSVLSVFERLKGEQATKPPEEKTAAATTAPAQPEARRVYVPSAGSRPVLSVFERLKAEQATKTPEEQAAMMPAAPARPAARPVYVPSAGSRPVLSIFERLKAERAKKAAEEQAARESADKVPAAKDP